MRIYEKLFAGDACRFAQLSSASRRERPAAAARNRISPSPKPP